MEAFLCEALVHVFQAIAEAVNTFATTLNFIKSPQSVFSLMMLRVECQGTRKLLASRRFHKQWPRVSSACLTAL